MIEQIDFLFFSFTDVTQEPSTSKYSKTREDSPPRKKQKNRPTTDPRTPDEVFSEGQPYSFFLTKVHGIDDQYNQVLAMGIKGSVLVYDILNINLNSVGINIIFVKIRMVEIPYLNFPSFLKLFMTSICSHFSQKKSMYQVQAFLLVIMIVTSNVVKTFYNSDICV